MRPGAFGYRLVVDVYANPQGPRDRSWVDVLEVPAEAVLMKAKRAGRLLTWLGVVVAAAVLYALTLGGVRFAVLQPAP